MGFLLPMLVGAAGTLPAYGLYSQGQQQKAMANHNAKVAEYEAVARQQAIEAEQTKLTKSQRRLKGRQRMSVASRGGLMGGTDLMSLANQAREMQMDQLELQRQQDLSMIRGASESAMSKYQGRVASRASKWTVASSLVGTSANLAKGLM